MFFSSFPSFLSFLLFFSFSHFSSHFLFSFGIFSPIWIIIDHMGQRRKFPPHFLMPFMWPSFFLFFFFISYFPFIVSSFMWLIVSHTFKYTTWLLPCVTLLGCHVASPKPCHVSSDTICLEKCEILATS